MRTDPSISSDESEPVSADSFDSLEEVARVALDTCCSLGSAGTAWYAGSASWGVSGLTSWSGGAGIWGVWISWVEVLESVVNICLCCVGLTTFTCGRNISQDTFTSCWLWSVPRTDPTQKPTGSFSLCPGSHRTSENGALEHSWIVYSTKLAETGDLCGRKY